MTIDNFLPEITGTGETCFSNYGSDFGDWIDHRLWFERLKSEAEGALVQMGMIFPVDEIAIMVYTVQQEYELIEAAVKNGFVMFNAADDHVETFPIISHYDVHYTFLRHEDSGYRLEVMRIMEGVSPLHGTLAGLAFSGSHQALPVVVHASFKVKDLAQLGEVEQAMENNEWALAQSCRSTYGAFSYWLPRASASTGLEVYLKPRTNLRDAR